MTYTMKNLLKKLIIILILALVATTAFAANGETFNIGGTVPLTLSLDITLAADLDKLDLNTNNSATSVNISTALTIESNASAGWQLYAYSANDGSMLNSDSDAFPYTLTYTTTGATGSADVTPLSTGVVIANEGDQSGDTTGVLSMDYTQSTSAPAGYYSDQLTLVLRAQ